MASFVRSSKVRFEDCDPAGIVFYPNYFLMLNRLIEDWFADVLGLSWGLMHNKLKQGVPTVNMQVAFKNVSRLDDLLDWSLEVRLLRSRSFTLEVGVSCQGQERVAIETTLVWATLLPEGIRSSDIPAEARAKMEAYLVHPATD